MVVELHAWAGYVAIQVGQVETFHFAERFQLFVIIALGESIVLTGATTSELELDAARVAAFGVALLGSAAWLPGMRIRISTW